MEMGKADFLKNSILVCSCKKMEYPYAMRSSESASLWTEGSRCSFEKAIC